MTMKQMKLKLIACEVFTRELSTALAHSVHIIDPIFLPFGLHNYPNELRVRLQCEIDSTESERFDYILLGYGLCSRGTAEITARSIPLVVPRAHDCITLFLGSRKRYDEEFTLHPGTYYYSPGWIERSEGDVKQGTITDKHEEALKEHYEEYVRKYGEDNAKFLIEQESMWLTNYTRAALIKTGVGPTEIYRSFTQNIAESRGWNYEEIEGDLTLIEKMVKGEWSEQDFLIVDPNTSVIESFDQKIITTKHKELEKTK